MEEKNKIYYVYVHLNKMSNLPFYVGMGKNNRIKDKSGRHSDWTKIVDNYGYYSIKIADDLTHAEANKLEKELIKLYRESNFDLVNKNSGGSGNNGKPLSENHKKKISLAHIGKKMPTRTAEHRKNLSESQKGQKRQSLSDEAKRYLSIVLRGRKKSPRTEEHIQKLKKSTEGHEPWNKGKKNIYSEETLLNIRKNNAFNRAILVYDINQIFINEFHSISEASRQLNISRHKINRILGGKIVKCQFNFKYKDEISKYGESEE